MDFIACDACRGRFPDHVKNGDINPFAHDRTSQSAPPKVLSVYLVLSAFASSGRISPSSD
jgi:hypothetical protein